MIQIENGIVDRVRFSAVVYGAYCALLPLNMILNFTGFTINKYIGILASALFLFDVIQTHQWKLRSYSSIFIVFLMWAFMTYTWTINSELSIAALSTLFNLIMLTLLGLLRGFKPKEIRLIKYFMVIPSAIIFFYLAPNLNLSYTRLTLQSAAGAADHNSLAANMVFPLLICIDGIKKEKSKLFKVINIICGISISVSLLLIASRGAILAAVISVLSYLMMERRDEGKSVTASDIGKRMLIVVVVIAIGSYIFHNVKFPAITRLKLSSISADRGMGRLDIWMGYWRAIWDSALRMFFGYGYGTEAEISRRYVGYTIGAHNVYLEHWATMGLFGFIILLIMLWIPFKQSLQRKDNLASGMMIALFVICLPLGFLANKGAWNVLMLSLIGMSSLREDISIEEEP